MRSTSTTGMVLAGAAALVGFSVSIANAAMVFEWTFEGATTPQKLTSTGSNTSTLALGVNNHAQIVTGGFDGTGHALNFRANGVDGQATLTTAQVNGDLDSLTTMTMSGWWKVSGSTDRGGMVSFNFGSSNYTVYKNTNATTANVRAGGSGNSNTNSNLLPSDTWVFLAFSWNGGVWNIYQGDYSNAPTLFQTITQSATNTGTGNNLVLGRINNFGIPGFPGLVDNLRIHNTALSAGDVGAIWTADVPEPTSLAAIGALAGMLMIRRRR